MFTQINNFITWFDGVVWGLPLIILILITGFLLTVRLGFLQVRHLGKALKFMVKNEEGGEGEVTSFGALCKAFWPSNTVPSTRTDTFLADHFIILRMVWENSGDGLRKFLHSLEPESVFSELVPLLR